MKKSLPNQPGLARRLAALFYDSLLLVALLFVATAIVLPLNHGEAFLSNQIVYPLYLLWVTFLFFGWFWTHGGQTLGMKAWKIKLCQTDTLGPVSWKQALVRFAAASVSLLSFGAGYLWILIDRDKKSWHDRISQTTVAWS